MMNKFLKKLVAPLVIGLFVFACNSTNSSSGGNSPSAGNAPDNSQSPSNSRSQSPASGSGETIYVQLPLSPDAPAADIIQQFSWVGAGGSDDPICNSYCFNTYQDGAISLSYFEPNQQLRIDVYYPTGEQEGTGGDGVSEFLTELIGQTDNNGSLDIQIDRSLQFFQFIILDQSGNIIVKPKGLFDLQYTKSSPNCPGNLSSRLAVGMISQVVYGNAIFLLLDPDSNESGILTILEAETKMTIGLGTPM